jgi:hypothetical protein
MVEIGDEEGCDAGCPAADRDPPSRPLLTVSTVFSRVARIRMTLFPARPSRLQAMSIRTARRTVWAREGGRRTRVDVWASRRSSQTAVTGRGAQKVGPAFGPSAARGHDFLHAGRNWVGVDDVVIEALRFVS